MDDLMRSIDRATGGEFSEDYQAGDLLRLLSEAADLIKRQVAQLAALRAERDALKADAERWHGLYRRAINEANGLTNYVEDRPELRSAEKRLAAIEAEARAAIDAARAGGGK